MATTDLPSSGNPALDEVNDTFHLGYDAAEKKSERDAPVLVLFAEQLVVRRNGATEQTEITPPTFHIIKAVTHAPIALYVLLRDQVGEDLPADVRDRLRSLRDQSERAMVALVEGDGAAEHVSTLLRRTVAFLDGVISAGRAEAGALADYALECGKLVPALAEAATTIQLDALHDAVEKSVRSFSLEEKSTFAVVVAGDHQARARSLGLQYFQKRLAEKAGAEIRIFYAEGAKSVDEAVRVCGAARVNRDLARAFFGDEKRLQRDILGDAAAKLLETRDPRP